MTTPEQDGTTEPGTVEPSTQTDSTQGNAAASAGMVNVPKAEWDSLKADVKRLSSEDRSEKDKAVTRLEKRQTKLESDVQPLLERAAQYMKGGDSVEVALSKANEDEDQAQTNAALRDLARDYRAGTLQLPRADNANGQSGDLTRVVAKYGLDENDTDVIEAMRAKTGADFEIAVANIALSRSRQKSGSAAEATAASSSAAAASKLSDKELLENYQKDMLAARGNPSLLKSIKEKAIKDKVPVNTVVFV